MSGVYISGMEMPTSCSVCELCGCYKEKKGDVYRCDITMRPVKFFEIRLDSCPLVPVPDHGRLIDADAMYRKIKTECNPYGKPTIGFEDGKKVLSIIDKAPTIIPANKEAGGSKTMIDKK